MSIENFLNNLEKQGEETAKRRTEAEEAKIQAEKAEKTFLEEYKLYFNDKMIPQIIDFKEKLAQKFDLEYDEPTIMQRNNYLSTLTLTPKFNHHIKKLKVQFTSEGGRKLVTISGTAENEKEQQVGEGHLTFQDNFQTFTGLNLENEVSKILDKAFIKN